MNEQSKKLITYLIANFNGKLGKTVLQKIVYLSELEAIEEYGKRFTDIEIKHYNYGPFAASLQPEVIEEHINCRYENKHYYTQEGPNKEGIDKDLLSIADTIIEKVRRYAEYDFSGKVFEDFINKAYHTLPFQETPFGNEIKFEKYIGNKFINKMVVDNKTYKRLINPDIKLQNKKLQAIVDKAMEQF
jgi:uncharacterized phage-associated protein